MAKYSKFIGAVVGSVIGALLVFLNSKLNIDLGGMETALNTLILSALASIGVYVAPANEPTD